MLPASRTVIVDEIHALARDKRGAHLALTLERLEHVSRGAAAAHRSVGDAAPDRSHRAAARRRRAERDADGNPLLRSSTSGHRRDLDLALELPDGELEAVASDRAGRRRCSTRSQHDVEQRRTTLVFVNTRRLSERLAHQLAERLGEDQVAAHHGSLSKERRFSVEGAAPRDGELRGARGDGVARARHRHRSGRARLPDRLAAQHRHLLAARRALGAQPLGECRRAGCIR